MKIAKFISSILVLGSSSATINIAIDNTKIEHAAQTFAQEITQIAHTEQMQNYTRALHQAQTEAGLEVRQSQRAIMKPAINDLKAYVHLFTPSQDCNVNGLAQCLNQFEATGQPLAMGMQHCSTQNDCLCRWDTLPIDKKMALEQKFGRSDQQMSQAFGELEQNVVSKYQQALQTQAANVQWINKQYANATATTLKQWGCNATCVNSFGANIGAIVRQCQCPTGIKYNETNEPFANANVDQMVDEDTELQQTSTKASTPASTPKTPAPIQSHISVGGLTGTVVLVFALQLFFCFGICCFTSHQVHKANNRDEKQKADFYKQLIRMHKQNADEEQAMQDLYGKQATK